MRLHNPLRRARALTTWTQETVAQELGVHRQTIARWEEEDFDPAELPLKTLRQLSTMYDVPVALMAPDHYTPAQVK